MENAPSSPSKSERSYTDAVMNSPTRTERPLSASPLTSPVASPLSPEKPLPQPARLQDSSPEIPLSSMPAISTQEQISIENSMEATAERSIEVNNSLGLASQDVNALLQNRGDDEGWQTVTPKKNRKKTKKAAKKLQDSNKRPHSDSPLKERIPKRHARGPESDHSEREAEGDKEGQKVRDNTADSAQLLTWLEKSPCPSPTLSLSTLDYTDGEGSPPKAMEVDDPFASETPRAEANARPDTQEEATPQDRAPPTQSKTPGQTRAPHQGQGNINTPRDPPPHLRTPRHETEEPASQQQTRSATPMSISASPPDSPEGGNGQEIPDENAPELWIETTEDNVTTNGKGFRRTATPAGGWPEVYLAASPTFNIAAETLREWDDIAGPVLWARPYRGKYEPTEAGQTKTIDDCKNVVKNLVYVQYDEDLAIVFPMQDLPAKEDNHFPHPYHLLISGLNQQQVNRLIDLKVVASADATFFFVPSNLPRQLYILTVGGLLYQDTPRARTLVETLVRRCFRDSAEVRAIIEGHSDLPTEEALDQALLPIRASFILLKRREGDLRAWNIYFETDPGYNDENYALLQTKMRLCKFNTIGFGKGYALTGKQQPLCTGCKSADHDSFNCPFSRLPGWLGFKPNGPNNTAGATDFADDNDDDNNDPPQGGAGSRAGKNFKHKNGNKGRGNGHQQRGRGRA